MCDRGAARFERAARASLPAAVARGRAAQALPRRGRRLLLQQMRDMVDSARPNPNPNPEPDPNLSPSPNPDHNPIPDPDLNPHLTPSRRSSTRRRLLTWGRVSATWTKRGMAKVALPCSSPMRPPTFQEPACWSAQGHPVGEASPRRVDAGEEAALLWLAFQCPPQVADFAAFCHPRKDPTRCGSRRSGRWWASPSTARSSTCCSTCPPSGPTARRSGCSRGGRSFNNLGRQGQAFRHNIFSFVKSPSPEEPGRRGKCRAENEQG